MIRHPCPFVFGEKLSECPPLGAFASTINNADAFFIEAFTLGVMFPSLFNPFWQNLITR
jgi:hypothetical protein